MWYLSFCDWLISLSVMSWVHTGDTPWSSGPGGYGGWHSWAPQDYNNWKDSSCQATTARTLHRQQTEITTHPHLPMKETYCLLRQTSNSNHNYLHSSRTATRPSECSETHLPCTVVAALSQLVGTCSLRVQATRRVPVSGGQGRLHFWATQNSSYTRPLLQDWGR